MKIILDPGHGGTDPGAIGPSGLKESNVAWKISSMVADLLIRYDIDVIFTREKNARVSLDKRVQIANNSKADYFVSIHINSATNSAATGTETFAFPNSKEGTNLAYSVQNTLVTEIKLADRGVKYADFYVLRNTKMPAILVEVAFINNPLEEKLLKDEKFLHKAAIGIAKGVLEYLEINYKNNSYIDDDISPWANEAMKWAKEADITDGSMPKEPVTLERLVTILHRLENRRRV